MKYDFFTELYNKEGNGFLPKSKWMNIVINGLGVIPGSIRIDSKIDIKTDIDDKIKGVTGSAYNKAFAYIRNGYMVLKETPTRIDEGGKIKDILTDEEVYALNPSGFYAIKLASFDTYSVDYYDEEAVKCVLSKQQNEDVKLEPKMFKELGIVPDYSETVAMEELKNQNIFDYVSTHKSKEKSL